MNSNKTTAEHSQSRNTKWFILLIAFAPMLMGAQDISIVSVAAAHGEKTYIVTREHGANVFLSDDLNCSRENVMCREAFTSPYRQRAIYAFGFHLPFAKSLAAGKIEFDAEAKAVISFLGVSGS